MHTFLGEVATDPLRRSYEDRARALATDPWADQPRWVRNDPTAALRGKKLIVCGSGMSGELRDVVSRFNVIAIVDDTRQQREDELFGVPFITTDAWLAQARSDASIVSLVFVASVAGYNHFVRCCAQYDLKALGVLDYFRLVAAQGSTLQGAGLTFIYGLPFFQHAIANVDALVAGAAAFDDEYSRFTYYCLLNYRLTANPNYLDRCAVGFKGYVFNRSFFELSAHESYVDGGGFDGDTIEGFVRAVRGRFAKAVVFEPFPELAARCEERVRRLQQVYPGDIAGSISVVPKGLWSHVTRLDFNPTLFAGEEARIAPAAPQSAHVVEAGVTSHLYAPDVERAGSFSIETTTIDVACPDPISLIKLEIEGSELAALRGATRCLAEHRPKLAISIYHKPEDLLTLTEFVRATGLGYKLWLRQHNPNAPDVQVCYARVQSTM